MKQLKKKDRERLIRSVSRRCRGGRGVPKDAIEVRFGELAKLAKKGEIEASPADLYTVGSKLLGKAETTEGAISAAFEKGRQDVAQAIDAASRSGCGGDINDVIVEGPHDGAQHDAECPACGNPFSYIAPVFPADDEGLQEALAALKA